ncbi:MAG: hypothetical protein RR193_03705 [Christensenellaceae bacterium]
MRKKLIILLAVVLAVGTLLAGCGGAPAIKRPPMASDAVAFEVTGSCTAVLKGDILTVSGKTNLMDGTNGIISVLNSNGTIVESVKITKKGDNLKHDFVVAENWPDIVYGFVSFDTQKSDGQPTEVKDAYGKKFENLTGKDVIWDAKGVIAVFKSEEVKVR